MADLQVKQQVIFSKRGIVYVGFLLLLLAYVVSVIGIPEEWQDYLPFLRNKNNKGLVFKVGEQNYQGIEVDGEVLKQPYPYLLSVLFQGKGKKKQPGKVVMRPGRTKLITLAYTCTSRMQEEVCGNFALFDGVSIFVDHKRKNAKKWKKIKRNVLSFKGVISRWQPPEADENEGWSTGKDDLGRFFITVPVKRLFRTNKKQQGKKPLLNRGLELKVNIIANGITTRSSGEEESQEESVSATGGFIGFGSDPTTPQPCIDDSDCPSGVCEAWLSCKPGDGDSGRPPGPYDPDSRPPGDVNWWDYDPWQDLPPQAQVNAQLQQIYQQYEDQHHQQCFPPGQVDITVNNIEEHQYKVKAVYANESDGEYVGQIFVGWNYQEEALTTGIRNSLCSKIHLFGAEGTPDEVNRQSIFKGDITAQERQFKVEELEYVTEEEDTYFKLEVPEPPTDAEGVHSVFCTRVCKNGICLIKASKNLVPMTKILSGPEDEPKHERPLFNGGSHDYGTPAAGKTWAKDKCPCDGSSQQCVAGFDGDKEVHCWEELIECLGNGNDCDGTSPSTSECYCDCCSERGVPVLHITDFHINNNSFMSGSCFPSWLGDDPRGSYVLDQINAVDGQKCRYYKNVQLQSGRRLSVFYTSNSGLFQLSIEVYTPGSGWGIFSFYGGDCKIGMVTTYNWGFPGCFPSDGVEVTWLD